MLTCIDVKFIFDNVRLGLSSSANILQVADVLRVVFLRLSSGMFLAIISPSSSFSCYSWNEWNVRHFFPQPTQPKPPIKRATKTTQPYPQVFSVTVP